MALYMVEYELVEKRKNGFMLIRVAPDENVIELATPLVAREHGGREIMITDAYDVERGEGRVVAKHWFWV